MPPFVFSIFPPYRRPFLHLAPFSDSRNYGINIHDVIHSHYSYHTLSHSYIHITLRKGTLPYAVNNCLYQPS